MNWAIFFIRFYEELAQDSTDNSAFLDVITSITLFNDYLPHTHHLKIIIIENNIPDKFQKEIYVLKNYLENALKNNLHIKPFALEVTTCKYDDFYTQSLYGGKSYPEVIKKLQKACNSYNNNQLSFYIFDKFSDPSHIDHLKYIFIWLEQYNRAVYEMNFMRTHKGYYLELKGRLKSDQVRGVSIAIPPISTSPPHSDNSQRGWGARFLALGSLPVTYTIPISVVTNVEATQEPSLAVQRIIARGIIGSDFFNKNVTEFEQYLQEGMEQNSHLKIELKKFLDSYRNEIAFFLEDMSNLNASIVVFSIQKFR